MTEPNTSRTARFRRVSLAVLVVYWLAIFTGTHWPHLNLNAFPIHNDKVLHFSAYAGLSFLIALCLSARRAINLPVMAAIFGVTVLYSGFDEVTQPFFGRTCDYLDALADAGGSLFGLFAFLPIRGMAQRFAGAYLVSTADPRLSRDQLVTVLTGSSVEAGMARLLLESRGIDARLAGEHIGSVAPWMSAGGGAGAVKVLVDEEHAEDARTLLSQHLRPA